MNDTATRDDAAHLGAAQLLGADDVNDWQLRPAAHAARLRPEAAPLRRILEHSAIQEIMRRFDRHDQAANEAQQTYKRFGRLEIRLGAAAAILGAIVLSMSTADLTPFYSGLQLALLAVQIVCAAGVAGAKFYLQSGKPFVKWQQARSHAETARIGLFETVCGMGGRSWSDCQHEGDYPLLPLQLAYFVRYQYDVELAYYRDRGRLHERAANRYVGIGAVLTFLGALAVAAVGLTEDIGDLVSVAATAALIAPLLLSAQTGLSRLDQDERNAARYAITYEHLERIGGRRRPPPRRGERR